MPADPRPSFSQEINDEKMDSSSPDGSLKPHSSDNDYKRDENEDTLNARHVVAGE